MTIRIRTGLLALALAATLTACGSTPSDSGANIGEPSDVTDEMPAGDPFLTCEAGNTDCTSDTDQPVEPVEGSQS